MKWDRLGAMACVIIVVLSIVAGVCYGAYRLALVNVGHKLAVAWAMVATAMVPLAALAGYKLGGTEARGVLAGIGLGTGPVVQTAEKIATVKAGAARALREPDPVIVELPRMRMIDVTPKQLPSGDDQVVM